MSGQFQTQGFGTHAIVPVHVIETITNSGAYTRGMIWFVSYRPVLGISTDGKAN